MWPGKNSTHSKMFFGVPDFFWKPFGYTCVRTLHRYAVSYVFLYAFLYLCTCVYSYLCMCIYELQTWIWIACVCPLSLTSVGHLARRVDDLALDEMNSAGPRHTQYLWLAREALRVKSTRGWAGCDHHSERKGTVQRVSRSGGWQSPCDYLRKLTLLMLCKAKARDGRPISTYVHLCSPLFGDTGYYNYNGLQVPSQQRYS